MKKFVSSLLVFAMLLCSVCALSACSASITDTPPLDLRTIEKNLKNQKDFMSYCVEFGENTFNFNYTFKNRTHYKQVGSFSFSSIMTCELES